MTTYTHHDDPKTENHFIRSRLMTAFWKITMEDIIYKCGHEKQIVAIAIFYNFTHKLVYFSLTSKPCDIKAFYFML